MIFKTTDLIMLILLLKLPNGFLLPMASQICEHPYKPWRPCPLLRSPLPGSGAPSHRLPPPPSEPGFSLGKSSHMLSPLPPEALGLVCHAAFFTDTNTPSHHNPKDPLVNLSVMALGTTAITHLFCPMNATLGHHLHENFFFNHCYP